MTLSKSRILMVGAIGILALAACKPTDPSKTPASQTGSAAATVNGAAISESSVDMLVSKSAKQGKPDTPELRKEIIDQLTMQVIISQEAAKEGLDKSPEVMDQIDMARQSILANAFIQNYLKNNPVSDETIKAEYEKIKGQMTSNEFKARHILVATEAEARDIIAKLKKNPDSFKALAREKSLDAGSKADGGDLGWFDARTMVPEFAAAVGKLTKGKITDEPVKSQYGYHIIQLEDSRPKVIPPLDQVKSSVLQQIQQQNLTKLIDELKSKASINITPPPAPAITSPKESKPAN